MEGEKNRRKVKMLLPMILSPATADISFLF
jgi:hypothetical protein